MDQTTTTGRAVLARWPTVAAVLFAGFVVLLGPDRGWRSSWPSRSGAGCAAGGGQADRPRVWGVAHHRRDEAVPRPYAEFCAVIDFLLGAAILVQL